MRKLTLNLKSGFSSSYCFPCFPLFKGKKKIVLRLGYWELTSALALSQGHLCSEEKGSMGFADWAPGWIRWSTVECHENVQYAKYFDRHILDPTCL